MANLRPSQPTLWWLATIHREYLDWELEIRQLVDARTREIDVLNERLQQMEQQVEAAAEYRQLQEQLIEAQKTFIECLKIDLGLPNEELGGATMAYCSEKHAEPLPATAGSFPGSSA